MKEQTLSQMFSDMFATGQFGHINVITFLLNTFFVWLIVHFLYYRKSKHRSFYFTYIMLSVAIYFLVYFMIYVLEDLKGKTGIGVGIGLFGIFSIMRYRTDAMPVREMTYLFSVICLSVINAMANTISFVEVIAVNTLVLLAMVACEVLLLNRKHELSKLVLYDRIELIKDECREQLIEDLKQRTGLEITRVAVGSVDFLRDSALIKVYYVNSNDNDEEVNSTTKPKREVWEDVKE